MHLTCVCIAEQRRPCALRAIPQHSLHRQEFVGFCKTMVMCLQVLTFPDDEGLLIRNALIIQLSVERLVLVNNQTQAMQLVRAQTGQQVRHCSAAQPLHGIHTLQCCAVYAQG